MATTRNHPQVRLAVLLPCYNEAATIGTVVRQFRAALPSCTVYVYDNNSTDSTVEQAELAGAVVRRETYQGKGNVVTRMFADIDADVYIMADGDGTYDAEAAPRLVDVLLSRRLDFVNAARTQASKNAYRFGHRLGNVWLSVMARWIFGQKFEDMLSGYKVLSRRFVKSFPALSSGFEVETELIVHALNLRMPCAEIGTAYQERPAGSVSKLRTVRDGLRILGTLIRLVKTERPLAFFAGFSFLFAFAGLAIALPIVQTYLETGLVPRLPSAVLVVGLMILSALSLVCGLILDTVTQGRRELRRLAYLRLAPPDE